MTIRIVIGTSERDLNDASESWINEQINRRKADGLPVCVKVLIDKPGIKMSLSTPTCQQSGGGGRPPNADEHKIFQLWERLHLGTDKFTGGNLIAFLKQLTH